MWNYASTWSLVYYFLFIGSAFPEVVDDERLFFRVYVRDDLVDMLESENREDRTEDFLCGERRV